MSYENKTNEELIELLEEKDEEVQELESRASDSEDELNELRVDNSILEEFREDKEEFAKSAFDSGYDSGFNKDHQLKAWLNYKIGERL